ncbi:hypothetical protein L596_003175 [Steinernema carpocapsae]|uniref:SSD domain-containing protein n=1 Tax=Steinernema carpocapsae TaxID=34508 RepID=A0A4U8URW8_STECR|nr:hypothetical protein L596_003175 [Steinernema carpocapsae]
MRSYADVLEEIVPCVWITPLDCFWDGAKPLSPPLTGELGMASLLIETAYDLPMSWSTIKPQELIDLVSEFADIGSLKSSLESAGISNGYVDRWCIDPYDPNCPQTAVNAYVQYCDVFAKYRTHQRSNNVSFNLAMDLDESSDRECDLYRRSFMHFLRNKTAALEFLREEELPKYPDYGTVMKNGCEGFARNVLKWPRDMIVGGAQTDATSANGSITAGALQTVFLVASSEDIYNRYKESSRFLKDFSSTNSSDEWTVQKAEEIILTWQRAFTKRIYNHPLNFQQNASNADGTSVGTERRIIHPLASTSMADMLEEFCQFNYMVIFVGYFLMLMYAIYSQMKRDGYCLLSMNSSMGLGFAGVLTVTYASISGLGLATWLGIEFNAATTQIVPFLTLGIGVDNMFMLLHNYHEVTSNVKKNEIGVLMKETGMSILMTSIKFCRS